MKTLVALAAALIVAAPAAAQSSHAEHHPTGKPTTAMGGKEDCPMMKDTR